jgi:hypothetical protein
MSLVDQRLELPIAQAHLSFLEPISVKSSMVMVVNLVLKEKAAFFSEKSVYHFQMVWL